MKLAQLQQCFQAHVLAGDEAIGAEISTDERFSASLRLSIYTQAYGARLIEVLGETFPAVQAALGPQRFADCVGDFVKVHPSRCRSARAYGEVLPAWLGSRLRGPRAAGIADLARFEWAVAGAFDAADASVLAPESVAGMEPTQWPRLQFVFTPTLRRLSVSSNCVAWWKYACSDEPRPQRWRATCPQQWLIWRRELAVFYRRLSRAETRSLDAALAGRTFAELCEPLSGPAAAAALLHGWLKDGLIAAVRVAATHS